MPLDPSISLQLQFPQVPNMLGTMGSLAQIQNQLNTAQMFRQTFAARQTAGQLIAGSDPNDPESAIRALMGNPLTAGYAPELVNMLRQSQIALLDMQGKQFTQTQSAMDATIKSLGPALSDPTRLGSLFSMNLAKLAPGATVTPQVKSAMGNLATSFLDGLPGNYKDWTPQDLQTYRNRVGGVLMSSGVGPDVIRGMTGALPPTVQQLTGPQGQPITTVIGGPATGGPPSAAGPGAAGPGMTNALTGVPGTPLAVGPSITQQQTARGLADAAIKYKDDVDNRVNIGSNIMQTVAEANQAFANIKPGGGANLYMGLARIAQAVGAPQDLVDKIGLGNYGAAQEFQKLMVNTTMGQIREQLQGVGGSRLSQMEFNTFQHNNPNLETDPRAIGKIFNFWTRIYNRDSQEQSEMYDYMRQGNDLAYWPQEWQSRMKARGIVQTTTPLAGSQQPPASAVPPGAKAWKIENGKLVPDTAGQQ